MHLKSRVFYGQIWIEPVLFIQENGKDVSLASIQGFEDISFGDSPKITAGSGKET